MCAHDPAEPAALQPAAPAPVRLLIVDDQPLIRRGLAMMLATEPDIAVVGQAADGIEAVEQALATRPDVVVMDLQLPRASGVVATRALARQLPTARVVVLTTFDDDELVFEAIRGGAHAYLLKDASEAEVLDTIRAVHRGESRLSPRIAAKVLAQFRAVAHERTPASTATATATPASASTSTSTPTAVPAAALASAPALAAAPATPPPAAPADDPALAQLTERELRILDLLAEGRTNKQIAAAVFLAEGTVKNYVSRIMDKLHARSRVELAMRVAQRGG